MSSPSNRKIAFERACERLNIAERRFAEAKSELDRANSAYRDAEYWLQKETANA